MNDKAGTDTSSPATQPLKTGAQCVIDGLVKAGCEVLFGYPGGAVLDIFNCLYEAPFNFVLTRHEQGASTWRTVMPAPPARRAVVW